MNTTEELHNLVESIGGSVRVGPFDIEITAVSNNKASAEARYGSFQSIPLVIEIQEDMASASKLVDTLFHEIFHAIYWVYGIDDKDEEERIVSVLGTGMAALIRDNPKLFEWVSKTRLGP